jgi:hypothetical protein
VAPASRRRFFVRDIVAETRRQDAGATKNSRHRLLNRRAIHLNDDCTPKNQQQSLHLVEKTRLAQMAALRPVPHPNRSVVADTNLDNFIRDLSVAIDKECRQTCKYSAHAKINLRAAKFSSRTISSTPCFYLSTPLQSFVYRIAGVAHR